MSSLPSLTRPISRAGSMLLREDGPVATAEPIVMVSGVVKRFTVSRPWTDILRRPLRARTVEALRGISLEVRAGEFFGLLGPNGAGKTTLFKILATLVVPDRGSVRVAGHDVTDEPATVRQALTPVIADERSLDWRLTGRQNLDLFASLYGVPTRKRRREIARLLQVVGLEDAADRIVGSYSSGMRQRLLIARALLSRPRVLLLDEPTRSLDPVGARDFRRFLQEEVAGRQGCTVLLATHDTDEALELCDRLAILHRGRLVAQGTAGELAHIAGDDAYRIAVPRDREEGALEVLESVGADSVRSVPGETPEWREILFVLPGGARDAARLSESLSSHGIPLAELARVPMPLADMIERLVSMEATT